MRFVAFLFVLVGFVCSFAFAAPADFAIGEVRSQKDIENDSIKVQTLDEVVVEAPDQYVTPSKSVYTPSKKVKEASYDAASLLMRMSIPEIVATPQGDITTLAGSPVAVYINGQKASVNEREMLKTTDVKRVEYMTAPADVRFQGASYVINFIVEEYLLGGYTKASEIVVTDFDYLFSNRSKLFNRFTADKVTFDVLAGFTYNNVEKMNSSTFSEFRFPDGHGVYNTVSRDQKVVDSKFLSREVPVSLSVNYKTNNLSFRNIFGYLLHQEPESRSHGELTIADGAASNQYDYRIFGNCKINNFNWDSNFYVFLSGGWSLNISNLFTHSHGDYSRRYNSGYDATSSYVGWRENAYGNNSTISINKSLPGNQSLRLVFLGKVDYNRIEYFGDYPVVEHLLAPTLSGKLSYSKFTGKLGISANVGLRWTGQRVNGIKDYKLNPDLFLLLNYMINSKNILYLSGSYEYVSAPSSGLAPISLRQNEFLYECGNPELRPYNGAAVQLSYMWRPTSSLQVGVFNEYSGYYDRAVYSYYPMLGESRAVVRQLENSGNFHCNTLGLRLGYSIPGKLNLQVVPQVCFYDAGGAYSRNYSPFSLVAWGVTTSAILMSDSWWILQKHQ